MELDSPMLHAKFQDHRPFGSGEADFLRCLQWEWLPSWSCGKIQSMVPLPMGFPHENIGHIHVYSPGAGTDNPPGSNFVQNHKTSVNLVVCCNFLPLNEFVTVSPIQMHRRPNLTVK